MSPVGTRIAVDLRRAPLADLRERRPARTRARLLGGRGGPLGSARRVVGRTRRRGLAPARRGAVGRGRPGLVAAEHVGHHRGLAGARHRLHRDRDRDRPLADRRRLRRRRLRPLQRAAARAVGVACRATRSLARLATARAGLLEAGRDRSRRQRSASDAAWGWVYMTLHGHYLDHLAVIEPWAATLRARQADGDPFVADPRAADHAAFAAQDAAVDGRLRRPAADRPARSLGRRRGDARLDGPRPRRPISPTGPRKASRAIEVFRRDGRVAGRPGRGDRRLERADGRGRARRIAGSDARPLRAGPAGAPRRRRHRSTSRSSARRTAGAGPTTASTATSASTLAMLGPVVRDRGAGRTRWPDAGIIERGPDRPHDRGDRRRRGAARVPPPPARPRRRLHGRGGRRPPAVHAARCAAATPTQLTASEKAVSRPAVVARRPAPRLRPRRRDLGRRGRWVALTRVVGQARRRRVSRAGRPTASASRSSRAVAAGRRSGSSMPRCRAAAARPPSRSRRSRRS